MFFQLKLNNLQTTNLIIYYGKIVEQKNELELVINIHNMHSSDFVSTLLCNLSPT